MKHVKIALFSVCAVLLASCKHTGKDNGGGTKLQNATVESVTIDGRTVASGGTINNVPAEGLVIEIVFSKDIDIEGFSQSGITLTGAASDYRASAGSGDRTLRLTLENKLDYFATYTLNIAAGKNMGVNIVDPYRYTFRTELSPEPVFPEIDDEELLTLVQERTFRYFWDHAHPGCGLARERINSNEVTTGGTGFGLMGFPAAVERGFVTREQAVERVSMIVDFLANKATRYHGAWSHWINGNSGATVAFSQKDNGADLVETAFLMQGLLTVQSYFSALTAEETTLRNNIQALWEEVEWNWFTRGGQNVLYWHWSPDYGWDMNMHITGWNEALIIYVLAASAPNPEYRITKSVYDEGWARNGAMKNGNKFYDITLPLGDRLGGPLFFAHYSFLGLDPRGLSDIYADYWEQNTAHARINHAYCVANPNRFYGYGHNCWGLTASDIPDGYTASSPTNDRGTIAPTGALASFPYTPDESMAALHFYYYTLGDKLFGDYGFKDAFNLNRAWFASSYLAIDQGPIIVMIENYRTGLIWDIFSQRADIVQGLALLGFKREN